MPKAITGNAHAFTLSVDPGVAFLETMGIHEFGDTKQTLTSPIGLPIFTGTVKAPAGKSGEQYRLVIREYDRLVADAANRSLAPDSPRQVWRLAFADVVEI